MIDLGTVSILTGARIESGLIYLGQISEINNNFLAKLKNNILKTNMCGNISNTTAIKCHHRRRVKN